MNRERKRKNNTQLQFQDQTSKAGKVAPFFPLIHMLHQVTSLHSMSATVQKIDFSNSKYIQPQDYTEIIF